MIVVEGPDGSGKTTLCQWICKQFNLEMGERTEKDRDKIYKNTRADSWKALHDECMATEPPRVWDRIGPYSDPIYSVHGIPEPRECAFSTMEVRIFHEMMMTPQFGVLVVCLPDLNTVLENVRKEHQLPGVEANTRAIYNSYYSVLPDALRYNYLKSGGRMHVAQAISVHLRHRQKRELLATHT